MRILVSAFAISPQRGSEGGVGWAIVSRLAERHHVTVLFGDVNGDETDRMVLEEWVATRARSLRLTLQYVPSTASVRRLERLHHLPGLHFMYDAAYHEWQKLALARARALQEEEPFDVTYQLTYTSYGEPGYLWQLPCPFFWGPVSGRTNVPSQYSPIFSLRGRVEIWLRNFLNDLTPYLIRNVGPAARAAAHIWCVTEEEEKFFRAYTDRFSRMLEAGSPERIEPRLRSYRAGERLEIVWSGLHIPRKALPLLLRALAVLGPEAPVHVHLLGSAPEGQDGTMVAKKLASDLRVMDKITWYGIVPHDEALGIMQRGHALVHTSIAEGTSNVILEALASGMPVICHDIAAMKTAMDASCGIKIAAAGPEQSVSGFAAGIALILREPELLEAMSRGAMERARQFSWEIKVQHIEASFARALPPASGT